MLLEDGTTYKVDGEKAVRMLKEIDSNTQMYYNLDNLHLRRYLSIDNTSDEISWVPSYLVKSNIMGDISQDIRMTGVIATLLNTNNADNSEKQNSSEKKYCDIGSIVH